jgi:hypothetical protein
MAYAEVETIVHGNPAGKARRKNMAKKLSPKQIRFFGTKRQRAALKAKRKHHAKAKSHRPRTKPNPAKHTAPRKKSHAKRTTTAPRKKKKKSQRYNPGEILSFALNSAKKGKHMAASHTKKKKKASAKRKNAGYKARPKHMAKRRTKHRNPGLGPMKDWLSGGIGVLAGVVGSRGLPQMVLGPSNTGIMGYGANAVATAILTWVAHMVQPHNRALSGGVLAGGVASIISRIISDYSLLGSYSSQLGLGDYMVSNWVSPQRLSDGLHSAHIENGYNPPMLVGQGSAAGAASGTGMGAYDSLY